MKKFNKNINNSYESETCSSSSGKSSNDSLEYEPSTRSRTALFNNKPTTTTSALSSSEIITELLNPNLTPKKFDKHEQISMNLIKQKNSFQCQLPPRKQKTYKNSSTESDFDGFSGDDTEKKKISCQINLNRINKSPQLMGKLIALSSGESDEFAGFDNDKIKSTTTATTTNQQTVVQVNLTPRSTEISSSSNSSNSSTSSNCSNNNDNLLIDDTPDSISVAPTENTPNSSFASSGEVNFGSSEISDQDERCQKDMIKMASHLNHLRNNTIQNSMPKTLLLTTEDTRFSIESNSSNDFNNSQSKMLLNIGDGENSCNAVDHTINNNNNNGSLSHSQPRIDKQTTSFDGIIQTITKKATTPPGPPPLRQPTAVATTSKIENNIPDNKKSLEINLKLKLLEKENRCMELINERSPDLFEESADESDNNNNNDDETTENDDDVQSSRSMLNLSTQDLVNDLHVVNNSSTKSQNKILETEKIILNRIQLSMSGVLPPPSVTILQYNILEMLQLYRKNYDQFNYTTTAMTTTTTASKSSDSITETITNQQNNEESLFKPTHTIRETSEMNWPDCMNVKCHGVHYNHSVYTENIEFLCMKYAERNIGAETMSTFSITSPSSGKKRMMRLKMLAKSPGNRLSHLAKRRAIFSSENLLKSNVITTESSKLGKNQLVIDTRKYDKRGKLIKTIKAKTPKRRTPGRKTPGSARKQHQQQQQQQRQLLTMKLATTSAQPTRETSKRALFQSPPKEKPKPQFSRDVASRVEKSKRVLFHGGINSPPPENGNNNNNNNNFQMPLKRKREEYFETGSGGGASGSGSGNSNGLGIGNSSTPFSIGNPSKIPRVGFGNMENLTPRSLKLAKSQSFCLKSTLTRNNTTEFSSNDKLFLKANSEQSLGMSSSQQLSNLHKQKILWAVAESLKRKNIASGHANFKQYASVLAKVVKRFYLELSESTRQSFSTSATMLKIANKHVILVLKGKTEDEIYLNEKYKQENSIDPMMKKLTGYIAPEQYEKYQLSILQRSTSNLFSADNSMDSFSQNYNSQISQSSEYFSSQSNSAANSSSGVVCNDVETNNNNNNNNNKRTDSTAFGLLVTAGGISGGSSCGGPSGTNNTFGSTGKRLSTFVYSSNSNSSSKTTEQTLNRSSSKNNSANVVLRENVDCDQRQKSGQKYYNNNNNNNGGGGGGVGGGFSGKDQKNVSPYTEKTLRLSQSKQQSAKGIIGGGGGGVGCVNGTTTTTTTTNTSINANILKAKRQISFDT